VYHCDAGSLDRGTRLTVTLTWQRDRLVGNTVDCSVRSQTYIARILHETEPPFVTTQQKMPQNIYSNAKINGCSYVI